MIAKPGHRDQEGLLVGKIALAAIHHRNSSIGGQALRHVSIECIGQIKAFEHRIVFPELLFDALGRLNSDLIAFDTSDPGSVGVEQPAPVVVPSSADVIALVDFKMAPVE